MRRPHHHPCRLASSLRRSWPTLSSPSYHLRIAHSNHAKPSRSIPGHSVRNKSTTISSSSSSPSNDQTGLDDGNDEHHHHHPSVYPVESSSTESDNRFLVDSTYIKRYRDPSRHDDYIIPDHHHPYEFRTRPTITQPLPFNPSNIHERTSESQARRERLNMEKSWLSSSSCQPSIVTATTVDRSQPIKKIGICFPGTGSQYIGMGNFLKDHNKFKETWEEAEYELNKFEAWLKSLNLIDSLIQKFGFNPAHAKLIGGPIRPSELFSVEHHGLNSKDRNLFDIVFKGPQCLLSKSPHAQPAILITSIAYLRTLEVESNMSLKSITEVYSGHSSGEFTACVASEAISFSDGIKLTRLYGLLSERSIELYGLKPSTTPKQHNHLNQHLKPEDHQSNDYRNKNDLDPGCPSKDLFNQSKAQMSALLINETTLDERIRDGDSESLLTGRLNHHDRNRRINSKMIDFIERYNLEHSHNRNLQVEIGSFNSAHQIVLSGTRAGILSACNKLHELEIANRAADLPCSSPFHSSFMNPASDGMRIGIESIQFKIPKRPILISTSSKIRKGPTNVMECYKDSNCNSQISSVLLPAVAKEEEFGHDSVKIKYIQSHQDLNLLKLHLFESIKRPVWWSKTINELISSAAHTNTTNHQQEGEKVPEQKQPGKEDDQHLTSEDRRVLDRLVFIGPGKTLYNLCKKQIGSFSSLNVNHSTISKDQPSSSSSNLNLNHHHPSSSFSKTNLISGLATQDDFKTLIRQLSSSNP